MISSKKTAHNSHTTQMGFVLEIPAHFLCQMFGDFVFGMKCTNNSSDATDLSHFGGNTPSIARSV